MFTEGGKLRIELVSHDILKAVVEVSKTDFLFTRIDGLCSSTGLSLCRHFNQHV